MQQPRRDLAVIQPWGLSGAGLGQLPPWVAPPASPLHPRCSARGSGWRKSHPVCNNGAGGDPGDTGTQGPHEAPCPAPRFGIKLAAGQQKAARRTRSDWPSRPSGRARASPGPGSDAGSVPPRGLHSYFTNQKQKVNGAGLTTYFPGALGDRLSASRLTHTLFIQSFKYPIVSVFSMLIFSILMIWSPALALLGLAAAWGFFFLFFFLTPF